MLAPQGRLVVLGFTGRSIPTLGVNQILFRNVDVVGSAYGSYLEQVPGSTAELHADRGLVRPLVGRRYPLEVAARALRDLDERRALGKSVLVVRA